MITIDEIMKVKQETCYIIIKKDDKKQYKQIEILKNSFNNLIFETKVDEFIKDELLEGIIPSYFVIKNGQLIEMAPILY